MKKIIFLLLFISSLLYSVSLKPSGCELSQVGDVALSIGSKSTKKANYKAIVKSGKNFRTILVGSTMSVDGVKATIIDIKAKKRIKTEARTGTITLEIDSQKVVMRYVYDKGHFEAKGKLKNGDNINFSLEIKALLCTVQSYKNRGNIFNA